MTGRARAAKNYVFVRIGKAKRCAVLTDLELEKIGVRAFVDYL